MLKACLKSFIITEEEEEEEKEEDEKNKANFTARIGKFWRKNFGVILSGCQRSEQTLHYLCILLIKLQERKREGDY